ncbi:Uncharacterized conserved protein (DUF2305)/Alpha/beta hydrolase family, putative [Leishmania donovani]|uniref:Uncharacterized conserved protein (DUF2305)/Alpha/beta hydrolase family, putative n=1 Tax=Leishmania donovani TaxID=5661 RepID=A0A3S7WZH7_LEIDO|nr:Uncharacterized conserved protein (DUF2305)/Alpha/beta hydrolase family, putative [Leishmania donovani]
MSSHNTIVAWRAPVAGGAVVDVLQSSSNLLQYLSTEESSNDGRRLPSSHRKLLVFFPGNPGLVQFYEPLCAFLETNKFDVLVMGYAGHSLTELNEGRVFSLADQVDIAESFVATLMNKNAERKYNGNIYAAGHSVGGFVALQMVARYSTIKKCFGLCPVMSHMRDSPNGRRLFYLSSTLAQWCLAMLAVLLELLPYKLRLLLITTSEPSLSLALAETLAHHLHRWCLTNSLYMAMTEFRMLLQPDAALLRCVQERLILYYVKKDDWAPLSFAEEIGGVCPRLGACVIEEDAGVPHAWCLNHSETVARNAILKHC